MTTDVRCCKRGKGTFLPGYIVRRSCIVTMTEWNFTYCRHWCISYQIGWGRKRIVPLRYLLIKITLPNRSIAIKSTALFAEDVVVLAHFLILSASPVHNATPWVFDAVSELAHRCLFFRLLYIIKLDFGERISQVLCLAIGVLAYRAIWRIHRLTCQCFAESCIETCLIFWFVNERAWLLLDLNSCEFSRRQQLSLLFALC